MSLQVYAQVQMFVVSLLLFAESPSGHGRLRAESGAVQIPSPFALSARDLSSSIAEEAVAVAASQLQHIFVLSVLSCLHACMHMYVCFVLFCRVVNWLFRATAAALWCWGASTSRGRRCTKFIRTDQRTLRATQRWAAEVSTPWQCLSTVSGMLIYEKICVLSLVSAYIESEASSVHRQDQVLLS